MILMMTIYFVKNGKSLTDADFVKKGLKMSMN